MDFKNLVKIHLHHYMLHDGDGKIIACQRTFQPHRAPPVCVAPQPPAEELRGSLTVAEGLHPWFPQLQFFAKQSRKTRHLTRISGSHQPQPLHRSTPDGTPGVCPGGHLLKPVKATASLKESARERERKRRRARERESLLGTGANDTPRRPLAGSASLTYAAC
jgi:hypothetical protein